MRIIAVLLAWLLTAGFASADIEFGLAKAKFKDRPWSSSEHRALMNEYGANDYAAVFWNLFSPDNLAHPFDWVRDNYLEDGCVPVIITILPNGANEDSIAKSELSEGETRAIGNHQDILDGVYDEAIEAFATRLRDAVERSGCDTRPTINLMHEADGSWYKWGMDAIGNSPQSYADAYIHIVDIFRSVNAPVDFQLNLNRRDGRFQVMRLIDEWFPLLDSYVDRYAISSYNRCGTTDDATEYRSFWQEFGPAYRTLAERTDKPIDVAEVSTSTLCRGPEDKLLWFEEMLASLKAYAPQTERVTFFFGTIDVNEASNKFVIEWGFPPELRDDFRAILDRFRALQETRVVPAEPAKVRPEARPTRVVRATRPVVRPVTTASIETVADTQTVLSFGGERSWNWEAWGDLRTTFGDEPIPGYGSAGTIAQGTLRFNYLDEGTVQSGPSILLGGVLSDNCDERYWQCQVRAEASYIWRWRPAEFGDYNRLQFGLGIGYRYYTDGPPARLENGDAYGFVGLTWVAGGDFKN